MDRIGKPAGLTGQQTIDLLEGLNDQQISALGGALKGFIPAKPKAEAPPK